MYKDLLKSEGGRGGSVIGHTKSGHPIYEDHNHPEHKDFSSQDHLDAAEEHGKSYKKTYDYNHREAQLHHLKESLKAPLERKEIKKSVEKVDIEQVLEKSEQISSTPVTFKSEYEKNQAQKILSIYSEDPDLVKAKFDQKEREKLAKEHEAEPDGSYPIRNTQDLENAIKAYGRSKDKEKTKAWIKKRAKELDAEKLLPETWEEKSDLKKSLDLLLSDESLLEKGGKRATIGEVRTWSGQKWVKHPDGWVLVNHQTGKHTLERPGGRREQASDEHVQHAEKHLENYNSGEHLSGDKDRDIHEHAAKIAEHAGMSVKEFRELHPETKIQLLNQMNKNKSEGEGTKEKEGDSEYDYDKVKGEILQAVHNGSKIEVKKDSEKFIGKLYSVTNSGDSIRFSLIVDSKIKRFQISKDKGNKNINIEVKKS